MQTEIIKCCPFCGSRIVDIARTNKSACWIECAKCGAASESARTREAAIARWNRRHHHDGTPATIGTDMDKDWP